MFWLVVALISGGLLLAGAVAADFVARRRAETEVPLRGVEEVDKHVPTYVSQDAVEATPSRGGVTSPPGRKMPFGLAHQLFVTHKGVASVEAPRLLLVAGAITSMRQLMATIATYPRLVIVATEISDEVAQTLAANRRVLESQILACVAGPGDLIELAEQTGGEVLTDDDLRAGYVPPAALGSAQAFAADMRAAWLEA